MEISGCQELGRGKWEVIARRGRVSFWCDEKLVALDSGDGCITL